jgi:membrane protease subunit HflC
MSTRFNIVLIALVIAAVVIRLSVFTVDQREHVLKLQFGEIVNADYHPGLHFKWPFVDSIVRFPDRILTYENSEEKFLTGEKKNLIVDYFVTWRVSDSEKYYKAVHGNEDSAIQRLTAIVKEGIKAAISSRTVQQVVSADRSDLMDDMLVQARKRSKDLGIDLVDVRVKRIDLSDEVSDSVFSRMRQERQRVAEQLRAEGDSESERIKADADRQVTVTLADAYKQAQQIRGEGDAKAAEIYAKAYGQNPKFYDFYRSMLAYKNSIGGNSDVLVLKPDSDFFKFLQNEFGAEAVRGQQ